MRLNPVLPAKGLTAIAPFKGMMIMMNHSDHRDSLDRSHNLRLRKRRTPPKSPLLRLHQKARKKRGIGKTQVQSLPLLLHQNRKGLSAHGPHHLPNNYAVVAP